ncbi:protein of unknown function [Shewanella benthica]|uniref:Uncharacterized protein n=1 Tax=Shewanella benthica TaxID=43661 RepID=A0A330M0P9_9GAMM|nr:protein of unknown function [Shewanella benthica]
MSVLATPFKEDSRNEDVKIKKASQVHRLAESKPSSYCLIVTPRNSNLTPRTLF